MSFEFQFAEGEKLLLFSLLPKKGTVCPLLVSILPVGRQLRSKDTLSQDDPQLLKKSIPNFTWLTSLFLAEVDYSYNCRGGKVPPPFPLLSPPTPTLPTPVTPTPASGRILG